MITDISIARRDAYTAAGEFDCTVYELRIEEDEEYMQHIDLDGTASVMALAEALNHYIAAHHLDHKTRNDDEE